MTIAYFTSGVAAFALGLWMLARWAARWADRYDSEMERLIQGESGQQQRREEKYDVKDGVKPGHWGGEKVGQ